MKRPKHKRNSKAKKIRYKSKEFSDLTVVLPTLNEEENIKIITERLIHLYPNVSIIVVDDNSTDRTRTNVKRVIRTYPKLRLLVNPSNKKGITRALLFGGKHARTEFIVFMDADLQHPAEKVREIYSKLKQGYDLVVGVRRTDSGLKGLKRKIISRTAKHLMMIKLKFYGVECGDPVSGFFGLKRELLSYSTERFKDMFEYDGYKILSDLLNIIIKTGISKRVKIGEVYYDFKSRRFGHSKLNTTHITSFIRTLIK